MASQAPTAPPALIADLDPTFRACIKCLYVAHSGHIPANATTLTEPNCTIQIDPNGNPKRMTEKCANCANLAGGCTPVPVIMQGDVFDLALIRDWAQGFWDGRYGGVVANGNLKGVLQDEIWHLYGVFKVAIMRHRAEYNLGAIDSKRDQEDMTLYMSLSNTRKLEAVQNNPGAPWHEKLCRLRHGDWAFVVWERAKRTCRNAIMTAVIGGGQYNLTQQHQIHNAWPVAPVGR